MREYLGRVGDFGAQRLSWHYQLRTGVVLAPEIEFFAAPRVGDPDNTTSQASSTSIRPSPHPGGYKARSGRDLQDCHQRDDTWNQFQTGHLVALRECESHPPGSAHPY